MTCIKHILLRVTMAAAALTCCSYPGMALTNTHFADTSRLANGRWVKIEVSQSGIHQITADEARAWGLGDLSRVHVFGMGGQPLSEKLSHLLR